MKKNNYLKSFIVIFFLLAVSPLQTHSLRPVPWVTHKAVLFLEQFMKDHPDAKILEFGSGSSTIWFAKRTKNLVSVEHSSQWFTDVKKILEEESGCLPVNLILKDMPYYSVCDTFPDNYFDLILVDGRNRSGCIKNSIRILKSGGILMLDNAERPYYQKALDLLIGWQSTSTDQPEPDTCGFTYPGWKTNWYVKP